MLFTPHSRLTQPTTRRALLGSLARTGAATTLGALLPWRTLLAEHAGHSDPSLHALDASVAGHPMDTDDVRVLALRAIDAARSAGAAYADVRLTRITKQRIFENDLMWGRYVSVNYKDWLPGGPADTGPNGGVEEREVYGVGVRVLVNGCWGFAASPVWTLDEMARLAVDAVGQAIANAKVTSPRVDLVPTPVVTGSWRPPHVIDPFRIPLEEKIEYLRTIVDYAQGLPGRLGDFVDANNSASYSVVFTRQEWALATSDGTFCTQERFASQMALMDGWRKGANDGSFVTDDWAREDAPYPNLEAHGWELCNVATGRKFIDEVRERVRAKDKPTSPPMVNRPIDVGRYTVVCSADVAVQLVGQIFGPATQLDRAMGYEVNASGGSFLDDPLAMVGTLQLGSPLFTLTGNRATPTHLATAKWDDEGVETREIPLITKGVLTDFQTTRETASWLAPYYTAHNRPLQSNGCAAAQDGLSITTTHTPNLVMQPGSETASVEDLIKDVPRGLFFKRGSLILDFQGATGMVMTSNMPSEDPDVREIVNGKLGDGLLGGIMMFRSKEFLKTLVAIGSKESRVSDVATSTKGQPEQSINYTVTAVPFTVKDATVIDGLRA